jgi:hypothetical protein
MVKTLQKINWNSFKIKNENSSLVFEELCYHLFCRKYKQAEGIRIDYNQKGIETYPIKKGEEFIGFQAKFFANTDDRTLPQGFYVSIIRERVQKLDVTKSDIKLGKYKKDAYALSELGGSHVVKHFKQRCCYRSKYNNHR